MADNWEDKYIEVDGVKTHYVEAGQGMPLVLIHGMGASACGDLSYGDVIPYLSKHFRVIAPDVIGFGLTPGRGPQDYTGKAQGDFLVKFMDLMDFNEIYLGGHSHGGFLVQYVAHERPNLVKRLIIINSLNGTKPIPPEPEGLKYIYGPQGHSHPIPTLENMKETMMKSYMRKQRITEDRINKTYKISSLNHEFARAREIAIGSTIEDYNTNLSYKGKHISEYAHELKMPVFLTWSRENDGSNVEDASRFLDRLKDGEMHVVVNALHSIQRDQSERFASTLIEWLKSERPSW